MKSFQELCDSINLLDFAIHSGYRVVKESSTRKNPVLKGPDGDVIVLKDTGVAGNCRYFNASEGQGTPDRGNLIEFTKQRIGSLFPLEGGERIFSSVNKVLHDYLNIPFEQRQNSRGLDFGGARREERPFDLRLYNLKAIKERNNYLEQRGLGITMLTSNAFKGRVYTNLYNGIENVAFPLYGGDNKTIIGLNFRSDDVNKNASASNRAAGIWTGNIPQKIERIVITESPIDCMSYAALANRTAETKGAEPGYENYNDRTLYVATFGRPSLEHGSTLAGILEKAKGAGKLSADVHLINAFDNDYTGQMFSLNETNFSSDGSYIIRAGVNFKQKEIEVNVWNRDKLSDKDLLMMGYREEEGGGRRVLNLKVRRDPTGFLECGVRFVSTLKESINEEMLKVSVTEKGLSIKAEAIPETARALNRAFCATFGPLQVMVTKVAIPQKKDFNEDLKKSRGEVASVNQGLEKNRGGKPGAGPAQNISNSPKRGSTL